MSNIHKDAYTNVRVPRDLKERALEVAHKNHMSLSDIVRLALTVELPDMESGRFHLRGVHAS